jgi:hypothetical protein
MLVLLHFLSHKIITDKCKCSLLKQLKQVSCKKIEYTDGQKNCRQMSFIIFIV